MNNMNNAFQQFNQNFMNMNLNPNAMNNIMYTNKLSLLSLIDSPILVQSHIHPLVYCLTLDRAKYGTSWICNKCSGQFAYNIPSFYCVFCDFDMCERCILSHHLFEIMVFDYKMNLLNFIMNNPLQLFNWQSLYPCHNHLLTLIKKVNPNFYWSCNLCKNKYGNDSAFYYCSLCDFRLCRNCVIQWKNQTSDNHVHKHEVILSEPILKISNPEYVSSTTMLNKNNNGPHP